MITIVDYGLGNIQAFMNIYKRLNIPCIRAASADELQSAEKIILPGVGAFDWAIQLLQKSGMRDTLDYLVLEKKVPVLGVCVGMQILAWRSDEGVEKGLGLVPGEVKRFDDSLFNTRTHLPHMGWNDVVFENHPLFKELTSPKFYFLHSYYFSPDNDASVLGRTDYGDIFASAVFNHHIYGVQFHPEKSHHWGVQLLKNFSDL